MRRSATARSTASAGVRREKLVQQVFRATAVQLGESGYVSLRFDDVARRAGVNKTSLYRRWPTKAELVRDMLVRLDQTHELHAPVPDTGSLRGDLRRMLGEKARSFTRPEAKGFLRLLFSDVDDFDVAAVIKSRRREEVSGWELIFERAKARGEIRPGVDPRLLVETMMSGFIIRRMVFKEPVDARYLDAVANLVLDGILLPVPPRARVRRASAVKPRR
jgi:AcrR family transcriptional regulator